MRELYISKSMSKWMLAVFIICLLFQSTGNVLAQAESQARNIEALTPQVAHEFTTEMQKALDGAQGWLLKQNKISDWTAIGLARNGIEIPNSYRLAKGDEVLFNRGVYSKVSELSLAIMGYSAAGVNTSNVAGINMFDRLVHSGAMENEGTHGLALAFLANEYDSERTYNRPDWYGDRWAGEITKRQVSDGSWKKEEETSGDLQSTALALAGLNILSYDDAYKEPAYQWLISQQTEDGSYEQSTRKTAYAIIALSALKLDANDSLSEPLHKAITYLLHNQLAPGAFSETSNGKADQATTEQAYLAITAYKYWLTQNEQLFSGWLNYGPRAVNVTIVGPSGIIAKGETTGYTIEDAVHTFLQNSNLTYTVDSSYVMGDPKARSLRYAPAYTSINNVKNDADHVKAWRFALKSEWVYDEHYYQANAFSRLTDRDSIMVYYGETTTPIYVDFAIKTANQEEYQHMRDVSAELTPFSLQVEKAVYGTGYIKMKIAAGLNVSLNGKTYTTNKEGIIEVEGLPAGIYEIIFSDPTPGKFIPSRYLLRVSSPNYTAFRDQNELASWAQSDMATALAEGIIQGTSKDPLLLSPKKQITRAEFVTLLLRVLQVTDLDKENTWYSDVKQTQWFGDEVSTARLIGITDVNSEKFRPNDPITREEAAIMLQKAGKLITYGSGERYMFKDTSKLSPNSLQAIQAVYEHRIMKGDNTSFRPNDKLTREEATTVVMRLSNYVFRMKLFYYNESTY